MVFSLCEDVHLFETVSKEVFLNKTVFSTFLKEIIFIFFVLSYISLYYEKYLNKIKPYLKGIINDLKKSDTWKIQLTIANNFIPSKDDNDKKCHAFKVTINDEANEVIKELFDSFKKIY